MRDIALTIIFFGILPFVFSRPYVGIYLWTWLGLMNPHRLTYGFAFSFPFAQITAIVTLISLFASKEPKRIPWTRETVLLLMFTLWMLFTTFFAFYPDPGVGTVGQGLEDHVDDLCHLDADKYQAETGLAGLGDRVVSGALWCKRGDFYHPDTAGHIACRGRLVPLSRVIMRWRLALIMIIPLMRYLQLQAKNFWIRQGVTVSMLLTGIAAIGTQSRGALVGMAAMGVLSCAEKS